MQNYQTNTERTREQRIPSLLTNNRTSPPQVNGENPLPDYFRLGGGGEGSVLIKPDQPVEEQANGPRNFVAEFKKQYKLSPRRYKMLASLKATIQDPNTSVFDIINAYQYAKSIGLEGYLSGDIYSRFGISTAKLPALTDPIYQDLVRLHKQAEALGFQNMFKIPERYLQQSHHAEREGQHLLTPQLTQSPDMSGGLTHYQA